MIENDLPAKAGVVDSSHSATIVCSCSRSAVSENLQTGAVRLLREANPLDLAPGTLSRVWEAAGLTAGNGYDKLLVALLSALDEAERVREAARKLVEKLDGIGPDPGGAFSMLAVRGMEYTGPTYGAELEALRVVLERGESALQREASPRPLG